MRGAAVIALTRLGHFETVPVARHWLKQSDQKTELLAAAAEVLSIAHHADAATAISRLLEKEATVSTGLRLALAAPTAKLVKPLGKLAQHRDRDRADAAIAALGRVGTKPAAELLGKLITDSDSATAVHSLARSPGSAASRKLADLLKQASTSHPKRLRALVLGAALRKVVLGDQVDGVDAALSRLEGCAACRGDAVIGFARAIHDPQATIKLLDHKRRGVARGAALASPWIGKAALLRAAQKLEAVRRRRRPADLH